MSDHECSKERELDRLDRGVLTNEKDISRIQIMLQEIKDSIKSLTEKVTKSLEDVEEHEGRLDDLEGKLKSVWWLIVGMGAMFIINNVGLVEFIKGLFGG